MLTGVLPVAVLDRVWHSDFTEQAYGAYGLSWDRGDQGDPNYAGSRFHDVSLHNPTGINSGLAPVELLVTRVTAEPLILQNAANSSWTVNAALGVSVSSAEEAYFAGTFAPSAVNVIGVRFGWLQPGRVDETAVKLPTGHLDCGTHSVQQIVSVNGIANDVIGPAHRGGDQSGSPLFEAGGDAPLRIKPGGRLMCQIYQATTVAAVGVYNALLASFYWSERPFEEE